MKVMLLAAGRGSRMGDLTNLTPKPLLEVQGQKLIEYHLLRLAEMKFTDVVINVNMSFLGDKIMKALGDGRRYGVNIDYSCEEQALETGGGILHALPKLGDDTFLVVNSDIWTDFPYSKIRLPKDKLGHLVFTENPEHHPHGDFCLSLGHIYEGQASHLTFTGIGLYHVNLFKDWQPGKFGLSQVLRRGMQHDLISGELYEGVWCNVDTPERLARANAMEKVCV